MGLLTKCAAILVLTLIGFLIACSGLNYIEAVEVVVRAPDTLARSHVVLHAFG